MQSLGPLKHLPLASVTAFMVCVALATFAQNLTGFAFGLILLGLTSSLHVVSVADAANAAMVLTLVNAWVSFRGERSPPPWRLMRPALLASLCGLLGLTITACAALLVLQSRTRDRLALVCRHRPAVRSAGRPVFQFGAAPGLSHVPPAPGQGSDTPRPAAGVRLLLVMPGEQFSAHALLLAACAVPVVYGVTRLQIRFPTALQARTLRRTVAALLLASGLGLLGSAWQALP